MEMAPGSDISGRDGCQLYSMKIAIVGLGYVGLPLSIQFARSGVTVLGIDVDARKVELLNDGQSYIRHIQSAVIAESFPRRPISHASARRRQL